MSESFSAYPRVEAFLSLVGKLCIFLASIALVTLVASFGWLVFGRYVLNTTPTWVEQLALLLICYITFLGAAAGIRDDSHLGVTLFRDMMPPVVQKLLIILIDVVLAIFGAVMLVSGITLMRFGAATMLPMLDVSEAVRTLAITSLGGLLVLLAGTRAVLRVLTFDQPLPSANVEGC